MCEVKSSAAALGVADCQNAHNMTVAVKGIVELYKAAKREKELHREVLAFSISDDHRSVRIHGHYAIMGDDKNTFYRHRTKTFKFTSEQERANGWLRSPWRKCFMITCWFCIKESVLSSIIYQLISF